MNLPDFAMRKPVTIVVILLVFLTVGLISMFKLPLEMMPEFSFPSMMVMIPYRSSSPEEVERTITRPLEEILSTLNNLKNINSTSSASMSSIRLEMNNDTNMDLASMEVRDKIDQVRSRLPADIENVRIRRWSSADSPVISFTISLPGSLENLYQAAEEIIKPELERIPNVANVDISGIKNKVLNVVMHPEYLHGTSLNILELINTIRNNNLNISAGYLEQEDRRFLLRIPGELKQVEQIRELPISSLGLKIKDVASVSYDFPEEDSFSRMNGRDSISFRVYRASNANVVEVCNEIRSSVERLAADHPRLDGMEVMFFRDQSLDITKSLKDLALAGVFGAFLAVLVLILFLRKFRTTLIIALAIPASIVFTFSFMYLARSLLESNITLNVISLSALMLAVGMLIDNAVVVLENIFRYKQDLNYGPREAAVRGSHEVMVAVSASTMTTLVVFVSINFISQTGFGRWMKDFGMTISLALVASLLVSLTVIPLAGSRLLKGRLKPKPGWLVWLTRVYEKTIRLTLRFKWLTMLAAAGLIFLAFNMLGKLEQEFYPRTEERETSVRIMMPRSFTLAEMIDLFTGIENSLNEKKEELAIANFTSSFGLRTTRFGRATGRVELYLQDKGPSVSEINQKLRELFPQKPGIEYEFGARRGFGGHMSSQSVELIGLDFTTLTQLAPMVMEKLNALDSIEDVTTDLEGGDLQLLVEVDRSLAESSGIDSRRVAQTIQSSLSDRPIGKFKTEDREIDMILQLRKEQGLSQSDLANLMVQAPGSSMGIPISALSSFQFRSGSLAIQKENKKSKLRINLNPKKDGMINLNRDISQVMNSIPFPEGYTWSMGQSWRQFRESQESSNLALLLALVFIYIIMASLFESFAQPFIILLSVPLSLVGVALVFTVFGITMNNSSYLGLLVLFGIVVNNGIVLVDHINSLRKSGLEKTEAIVQGGKNRLRPIMMTAITTIFSVLPMSLPVLLPQFFAATQGRARMWAPISIAVLGGLSTSAFFTLIIMPTFYSLVDSLASRTKKLLGFKPLR